MNELDRRAAAVVRAVVGGTPAVVTRHGRPVALIVGFEDREGLRPAPLEPDALAPLRDRFARREDRRWWSRIMHGRWCNGHGIHGPYRRYRRGRRR